MLDEAEGLIFLDVERRGALGADNRFARAGGENGEATGNGQPRTSARARLL